MTSCRGRTDKPGADVLTQDVPGCAPCKTVHGDQIIISLIEATAVEDEIKMLPARQLLHLAHEAGSGDVSLALTLRRRFISASMLEMVILCMMTSEIRRSRDCHLMRATLVE